MANISIDFQIDASLVDDEAADIKRCLALLYSTPEGSVPLARGFGIDQSLIDYPAETAKSLLAAEIVKKTNTYEPRVDVKEIKWSADSSGLLKPEVVVSSV